MSDARILGSHLDPASLPRVLTALTLELPALDFVVQWRRCGMTADYVAQYLAYSFDRHETAHNVLSTVANELLENAAKFTGEKKHPIRFEARHRGSLVELVAENRAEPRHVAALEALFAELGATSAQALFTKRVEGGGRGGLGLVILVKDYAATLGAVLGAPDADGLVPVTVRAALTAEEVEQR